MAPSSPLLSRPRASSRPAPPQRLKSTRDQPISLQAEDIAEQDEWEPTNQDADLTIDEIRESIGKWEDELRSRGRDVSGRTM
jgi:hypothetical protein